jgi:citrate/tricarballylate utilization protein
MSTATLNTLINQVRSDSHLAALDEVARQMQICNACRYCESFCAVFPAMTRRLDFTQDDIHYLANLCHNCGACLHACQYAPPHEFAVNVPQAMAKVRVQTYAHYAWPPAMGALYQRNGLALSLALAGGLALFLLLAVALRGSLWHAPMAGNFYAIFPHNLLVVMFGSVLGFSLLAMALGARRFWQATRPVLKPAAAQALTAQPATLNIAPISLAAAAEASSHALRLKYLDGGHGEGCHNADDAWTHWRRRFHHITTSSFALCLASTSVATLYHYALKLQAPYALTSLPVLLGTVGGIGLLVGPAGLFWLKTRRHPLHGDAAQNPMDYGFIALLFFTSLTGLALMWWRDTSALAILLAVHLGVVMALFATLPYGKMAHAVYRCAALLKFAIERRLPTQLKLSAD